MRAKTIEIFPTIIKQYDVSDIIEQKDVDAMLQDINDIHENHPHLIHTNVNVPPYQCLPILFNENYSYADQPHWHKLAMTFVQATSDYNSTVKQFCKNQDSMSVTYTRAWFYKSCRSVYQANPLNPLHNHNPSYLSGVFYLHVPGNLSKGGTEFSDPRTNTGKGTQGVEIQPLNISWVIFPGWLDHRAGRVDTDEWRYTIAADLFVRVD